MEMPITKVEGARKATASRRASNAQRKYALQQDVGMFLSFYFFCRLSDCTICYFGFNFVLDSVSDSCVEIWNCSG